MLQEKTRDDALSALIGGKDVVALTRDDDGRMLAISLSEMLGGMRFLVDEDNGDEPDPDRQHSLPSSPPGADTGETALEERSDPPCDDPDDDSEPVEGTDGPDVEAAPEKPEEKQAASNSTGKKMTYKEIVQSAYEMGLTAAEISRDTGIPYNTASYYIRELKKQNMTPRKQPEPKPKPKPKPAPVLEPPENLGEKGWNKDRRGCEICAYRSKNRQFGCNYIDITKQTRGCLVEDCNKWKLYEPEEEHEKDKGQ